jgi:hypothetical protein
MKCEESQAVIEEYFDGELETETARRVSIHLENCLSCRREWQQLSLEDRVYQKYERGVDPSPALWPGVSARIAEELPVQLPPIWERWQVAVSNLMSLRFNVAVSAALVLSAVVGTVAVMKYLNSTRPSNQMASGAETGSEVKQPTGPPQSANAPKVSGEDASSPKATEIKRPNLTGLRPGSVLAVKSSKENPSGPKTPSQLVRAAEKNYLSAIAMLNRDVAKRPSPLDSETRANLEGALASIDRTISATRRAVKKNPNDPLAVQYMLTAYAKKVDVLKEMTSY